MQLRLHMCSVYTVHDWFCRIVSDFCHPALGGEVLQEGMFRAFSPPTLLVLHLVRGDEAWTHLAGNKER